MNDDIEKKKCPYCGKMTSVHANFCWYCARELVARPEHPMEEDKPGRINWLTVLLVVVVLAGIALVVFAR